MVISNDPMPEVSGDNFESAHTCTYMCKKKNP